MAKSSVNANKRRYAHRNALMVRNRYGPTVKRPFGATPVGRKVTSELFLEPLADFLSRKLEEKPEPPPGDLGSSIARLDPQTLALIALTPILDGCERNWNEFDDSDSAEAAVCIKIGQYLDDRLALEKLETSDNKDDRRIATQIRRGRKPALKFLEPEWGPKECHAAGFWLMQCAMSLDYFGIDERGSAGAKTMAAVCGRRLSKTGDRKPRKQSRQNSSRVALPMPTPSMR
jgi:hypothetical protein